jgi:hypothetical protein
MRDAAACGEARCDNRTDAIYGPGADTDVGVQVPAGAAGRSGDRVMAPADTDRNLHFGLLAFLDARDVKTSLAARWARSV